MFPQLSHGHIQQGARKLGTGKICNVFDGGLTVKGDVAGYKTKGVNIAAWLIARVLERPRRGVVVGILEAFGGTPFSSSSTGPTVRQRRAHARAGVRRHAHEAEIR